MDPRRDSFNTRKGMMFKTVTLLNAAQTHWRLTLLQQCTWANVCRGVFDIDVYVLAHTHARAHTRTHTYTYTHIPVEFVHHAALMQSDSILCVQTKSAFSGNCCSCDLPYWHVMFYK